MILCCMESSCSQYRCFEDQWSFFCLYSIRKGNFRPGADKEGKGTQTALWPQHLHTQPCLSVNKLTQYPSEPQPCLAAHRSSWPCPPQAALCAAAEGLLSAQPWPCACRGHLGLDSPLLASQFTSPCPFISAPQQRSLQSGSWRGLTIGSCSPQAQDESPLPVGCFSLV